MTQENIEAFLSVVYNGSFSKAAESMYSTQTTVSRHIKQLEDSLGYPLFKRGQGQRTVQLTSQGQDFLPLAERWRNLYNLSLSLKSPQSYRSPLFISASDRINYFFLPEFYKEFNHRHPEIFFNNCTYHSLAAIEKIKTGDLDACFVSIEPMLPSAMVHRFHTDSLVMICPANSNYPKGKIHPKQLLPENEVRITPDIKIQQWYGNWWNYNVQPYTMIDTVNMLSFYLTEPQCWAVCPKYVAEVLCRNAKLEMHEFSVSTPEQNSYFIYNKNSFATKPMLEIFVKEFTEKYPEV